MDLRFQQAFDLTAHADEVQPAYWFYALFLGIGVGLLALAIVLMRHRLRRRKFTLAFAIFWLGFTSVFTFMDAREVLLIRDLIQRGDFAVVEGCLAYFHPGHSIPGRGDEGESWSVGGVRFRYGAGEIRPGYRLVEPGGGAVHADTRVRVSFVTSQVYQSNLIVKLDVAPHACPPAPDTGPRY